jgi:hypothetical protein
VPVPVPGHPVGAVLCRYAGFGEQQPAGGLAGAAKVTSSAQVARLQSAMNASTALLGTVMGCVQGHGDAAIVIIVYPAGTPDRTVVTAVADRDPGRVVAGHGCPPHGRIALA